MNREKYICHVTLVGSVTNFLLVVFKFVAGIMGNSSAMIADAAHSLSDFASDIIVLLCMRISGKPEDDNHPYGHGKFETLASVVIGLILLGTGIGIFVDGLSAIIDLFHGGRLASPSWLAFIAAIVSIMVKEGLYHYTMAAARKTDSGTLGANAWHHRSDAMSSVATVIGIGGAMLLGGKWTILDPLAACLISLFIAGMAFSLMKPGIEELLEKSLPESEKAAIEKIISTTPGVLGYHHLRTRRIGVNKAIEAHVKLDGDIPLRKAHDIATDVEKRIRMELGYETHIGIHMEPGVKRTASDINQG